MGQNKTIIKMPLRILGPKSSACCAFLSAWGIIFMLFLGVAFHANSPALREDLAVVPNADNSIGEAEVRAAYADAGTNCLLTSALYAITLLFSIWQVSIHRATKLPNCCPQFLSSNSSSATNRSESSNAYS